MYRIENKRAQKDIGTDLQQSQTCMYMNTDKRVTFWCISKLMIEIYRAKVYIHQSTKNKIDK